MNMSVVSMVAGIAVAVSSVKVLRWDAAIIDIVVVVEVLTINVRPGVEVIVVPAVAIALEFAVPKRL